MEHYHIFSGNKKNATNRQLKKSSSFDNPVIIIDGFNGSGKTLLAPIVAAFPKVEVMTFAYQIEWLSSIFYADKISTDAYKEFVKMHVDEITYNQQMSRSVNFRFSDLSSIFKSTKRIQYLLRLFKKGDDELIPIIKSTNPISCFTTNCQLPFYTALNDALDGRLLFIETVKDPLTMFEQLYILGKNTIETEKDFTFRVFSKNLSRSFLDYYSDEIIFENNIDLSFEENLVNWLGRIVDFLCLFNKNIKHNNLIFVPFENFVLSPHQFVEKISKKLGVEIDSSVRKQMKKQKVPRELLSAGLKLPIYKRYGAKNISATSLKNERQIVSRQVFDLINDEIIFEKLIKISEKYNYWKDNHLHD